jgi:predicted metalloprotease with PDZ domain
MNKLKLSLIMAVLVLSTSAYATDGGYKYTIDLTKVIDNKVYVELSTPKIDSEEIMFYLPKMIPGTYSIEDYGRFLSGLKAFDKKGRELPVEKIGTNSWKISKADKMKKLSYWIEDTFHSDIDGPTIFQPAGTNIEEGKNFVINASGFFGYFEGKRETEYNVQVIKPENFYGGTGMIPVSMNDALSSKFSLEGRTYGEDIRLDHFKTASYDQLVDSPILYCEPDTAVIKVAGAEVLISVYSPNKLVSANQIAETLDEVLMAQKDYLGGILPVDKYAFLFYFTDQPVTSYGALEHSYSSFYYMPEMEIEPMKQQLRDFAAHEFFHIVTPLNIHSEEIGHFDFNDPKMSKHLWLYEGMTEYFAGNAQVKGKLISTDEYLGMLRQKLQVSSRFIDSVAFTDISLGALDQYEDQYYNVYQKGALIGLCLDITLRELSDGAYGVQDMMADLSKIYGMDKSFVDDELFDAITKLTYPEVGEFLNTYVGGTESIPYDKYFEKVGIRFSLMDSVMDYSFGISQQSVGIDFENGTIFIQKEELLDPFGKALGFKNGDIIKKMNGVEFPKLGPGLQEYMSGIKAGMEEGKTFTISVEREAEDTSEVVVLAAEIFKVKKSAPFNLTELNEPTTEQLKLKNAWLGIE